MVVSGGNLSLFGRTALSNVGGSRAGLSPVLEPVDPTGPLKDATSGEYRELQDLKQRDREVRQHGQAHIGAGGAHVRGGASFSYESGPDGRQYAVGGEVQIDTSAAAAAQAEARARIELREQPLQEESSGHVAGDGRRAQNALSAYRGAAATLPQTRPEPLLDLIV